MLWQYQPRLQKSTEFFIQFSLDMFVKAVKLAKFKRLTESKKLAELKTLRAAASKNFKFCCFFNFCTLYFCFKSGKVIILWL